MPAGVRLTGALHVYCADFFNPARRSEWDPETLTEQPFDPERAVSRFEQANKGLKAEGYEPKLMRHSEA
jgi:hypothetical protein